jgi:hypothetical protein
VALKAVKVNEDGRVDRGSVTVFAEKVGVPLSTIINYRYAAKAWPKSGRPEISFTVAHQLAGQEDRFELVASKDYTLSEARELVRSRRQPRLRTTGRSSSWTRNGRRGPRWR